MLSESPFSFTPNISPQTVTLRGRLDAVYRYAEGTIEIVDFKSGRAPRSDSLSSRAQFILPAETAVQMAAYGLLALDAWAVAPHNLRTTVCYLGDQEPVLHTMDWTSEIAQVQRNVIRTHINKALSGSSAVLPGDACTHCDFNAFCEGAMQRKPAL